MNAQLVERNTGLIIRPTIGINYSKALAYARNDASGTKIDSYSHYYSIIDLATGSRTRLSYNNEEIAYSGGRFAQRSVIFNNKAYIEYYFDMIRVMEND